MSIDIEKATEEENNRSLMTFIVAGLSLFLVLKHLKQIPNKVDKQSIENINKKLNKVVQHLINDELKQAEELARKVAFYIPQNHEDKFWSDSVRTLIRAVILALAEDVASSKSLKLDISSIFNFLESEKHALDGYFDLRADNSLSKKTYKLIYLMGFETKNRVISEAMISIKLRLQEVEI